MTDPQTMRALLALSYQVGRMDERGASVSLPDSALSAYIEDARAVFDQSDAAATPPAEMEIAELRSDLDAAQASIARLTAELKEARSVASGATLGAVAKYIGVEVAPAAEGPQAGYFWRILDRQIRPDWTGPLEMPAQCQEAALETVLVYAAQGAAWSRGDDPADV